MSDASSTFASILNTNTNQDTEINNIKNIIPSYLQTYIFNNTINSYLTTSNASSTYATVSNLNLKANLANLTFTGTLAAPTINASTLLQIAGIDITTLYQEKPWVAGQVNQNSTAATIAIQSGRINFTATRHSTGNTIIGFPNIGGFAYTPFIQLRSIAGFTSFVRPTSTQFQLLTFNSSAQAVDASYTFFIYRTF